MEPCNVTYITNSLLFNTAADLLQFVMICGKSVMLYMYDGILIANIIEAQDGCNRMVKREKENDLTFHQENVIIS
jgi:hypothetical protein